MTDTNKAIYVFLKRSLAASVAFFHCNFQAWSLYGAALIGELYNPKWWFHCVESNYAGKKPMKTYPDTERAILFLRCKDVGNKS